MHKMYSNLQAIVIAAAGGWPEWLSAAPTQPAQIGCPTGTGCQIAVQVRSVADVAAERSQKLQQRVAWSLPGGSSSLHQQWISRIQLDTDS